MLRFFALRSVRGSHEVGHHDSPRPAGGFDAIEVHLVAGGRRIGIELPTDVVFQPLQEFGDDSCIAVNYRIGRVGHYLAWSKISGHAFFK